MLDLLFRIRNINRYILGVALPVYGKTNFLDDEKRVFPKAELVIIIFIKCLKMHKNPTDLRADC